MRSCGAQEGHPHPVWGLERPQFPLSPLTPQALTLWSVRLRHGPWEGPEI